MLLLVLKAGLLRVFPFSVALLNIPRVENQFSLLERRRPSSPPPPPPPSQAAVLRGVFARSSLLSPFESHGQSYRIQCDFLPIKIG